MAVSLFCGDKIYNPLSINRPWPLSLSASQGLYFANMQPHISPATCMPTARLPPPTSLTKQVLLQIFWQPSSNDLFSCGPTCLKVMFVWSHAGQVSGDYIMLGGFLNVSHLNWMKDIQTSQAQHGEHRYHYNLTLWRLSLRLRFRIQVKAQSAVSESPLPFDHLVS